MAKNYKLSPNYRPTILVVDDIPENIHGLLEALKDDYGILVATDGQKSLDIMQGNSPADLILLDIKMPGINGYEVCRQLKSQPDTADIPILFVTVVDDAVEKIRGFALGAADYITKPFDIDEVRARVKTHLELSRLRRTLEVRVKRLNEYQHANDAANIISRTDPLGVITYVNDSFIETYGYSREELIGNTHRLIKDPETPISLFRDLWHTIQTGKIWRRTYSNRSHKGELIFINNTIVPILDSDGKICEYISSSVNVTHLIKQEELLREQTTDKLTGLPNRVKLMEDLQNTPKPLLGMINIDQFKAINDFYGLFNGDKVLLEVGERLQNMSGEIAQAYRIGGDLFALLAGEPCDLARFEQLVDSIMKQLENQEVDCDDACIYIQVTAGISSGSDHIYTHAALALARARTERRDYLVYNELMQVKSDYKDYIRWSQKIRSALTDSRIVAYYQPILDNRTGKIVKHEALMRMIDEDGTVIPPSFLNIAKRSRQYAALTKTMVEQVIDILPSFSGGMTINLMVEDLLDPNTVEFLDKKLSLPGVGSRIVLEITESEGIDSYEEIAEIVNRMKGYGCKFAIDDFGSGYSNFIHLLRLKIDYLKIDGSIILNILKNPDSENIAHVIVDAARRLGMLTIAEFVCSAEIYNKVVELGIDFSQGYFIGHPGSIPQADTVTAKQKN